MNILHINTLQHGGAALCAMRINNALKAQGIDSRMLFAEGTSLPEGISGAIAQQDKSFWDSNIIGRIIRRLFANTPLCPSKKYKTDRQLTYINNRLEQRLYMHSPFSYYKNIINHPLIKWADIVHLHWVADFVDYPSFFTQIKKPIVWTLHDQHPAIGILHFETPIISQIPEQLQKTNQYCKKIKKDSLRNLQNLTLVAISKQMKEVCKQSDILKQFPTTIINNGINEQLFKPVDKSIARQSLGIPADHIVFAFCANNLSDKWKGTSNLIRALEGLHLHNITLVCIGGGILPVQSSINILKTGYIYNEQILSALYSSADYYLMPSFSEGFAQVPMEAMACGTPVIAYPCSGTDELITDECGIICDDFTIPSLVKAIKTAMGSNYDRKAIRSHLIKRFSYSKIITKYTDLYRTILQQNATVNNHN